MFDDIGSRMKNYESSFSLSLPYRLPMIIRLDGKAFHTFTRGFKRPWDPWLINAMQNVAAQLCYEISGSQVAYLQSDEISILVRDDMNLNTQPWFNKNIQKITSVSAGIASADLTKQWLCHLEEVSEEKYSKLVMRKLPTFDSRCFVLPKEEVCNYFVWRQQDAVRNSIQMLGQHHFSDKELHKKSCNEIQEMLFQIHKINWNDLPAHLKRGNCLIKIKSNNEEFPDKMTWVEDREIPTFSKDRNYIERFL